MTIKKQKKRLFKKKIIKHKPVDNKHSQAALKKTFFGIHEKSILFILIPLTLFIIFFTVYLVNIKVINVNKAVQTVKTLNSTVADYPMLDYPLNPFLSAKSAYVMEADSKKEIYSKNPKVRFSMASTAKIMTALVALDYYQERSVLTVKSSGVEGSVIGLLPGENYFFIDLLYAMMLPSANDAAHVILDNYPGGRKAFVDAMNKKAAEFHLDDTSFTDPAGLDDDGNFTTASDLAHLGAIARKNKTLKEIVATREKYITDIYITRDFILENLNQLLGTNGVDGIKTGTTEGAGEVLVTSALINDHVFIIVVMNSTNRFADTSLLLNSAADNVRFVEPRKFN